MCPLFVFLPFYEAVHDPELERVHDKGGDYHDGYELGLLALDDAETRLSQHDQRDLEKEEKAQNRELHESHHHNPESQLLEVELPPEAKFPARRSLVIRPAPVLLGTRGAQEQHQEPHGQLQEHILDEDSHRAVHHDVDPIPRALVSGAQGSVDLHRKHYIHQVDPPGSTDLFGGIPQEAGPRPRRRFGTLLEEHDSTDPCKEQHLQEDSE